MSYTMRLKDGTVYELDDFGAVMSRTDGPKGWDYSGKWIILGFLTRHNAYLDRLVTLDQATTGTDTGQGWVVDNDHGTIRVWGSPRLRKLAKITRH